MSSMLTQVLSASSIIIGLYIIVMLLFNNTSAPLPRNYASKPVYHIGCFLVPHNVSQSSLLRTYSQMLIKKNTDRFLLNHQALDSNSQLSNWKNKMKVQSIIPASLMPTFSTDRFSNQAVQVASAAQKYMEEWRAEKQNLKEVRQLGMAVKKAYQDYEYCSALITNGATFEENQCRNNWLQYENCSSKLSLLKSQLSLILQLKYKLQDKFSQELISIQGKLPSPSVPPSTQNENLFRQQDRQFQMQQISLQSHLRLLQQKQTALLYSISISQNETHHSLAIYAECAENRKEFRLCQEISQEVRTLGFGDLNMMWNKVDRKRLSIVKMQSMLKETTDNEDRILLQDMKNKSLDQYRKLHRIFIQTKNKYDKNCGCTEDQEARLLLIVNKHRQDTQSLKSQLAHIISQIQNEQTNIQKIKQARKQEQIKFQQRMQQQVSQRLAQEGRKKGRQAHHSILQQYSNKQKQINSKILIFETGFEDNKKSCKILQQQMSKMLSKISEINDCLLKKQYYKQLQSKFRMRSKGIHKLNSQAVLRQMVENFRI